MKKILFFMLLLLASAPIFASSICSAIAVWQSKHKLVMPATYVATVEVLDPSCANNNRISTFQLHSASNDVIGPAYRCAAISHLMRACVATISVDYIDTSVSGATLTIPVLRETN